MINACGKSHSLERAFEVFEWMKRKEIERTVVTYSALVTACGRSGDLPRAVRVMNSMRSVGFTPTKHIYTSILNACARTKNLPLARRIFQEARTAIGVPDEELYAALVNVCVSSGAEDDAKCIASQMEDTGYDVSETLNGLALYSERSGEEISEYVRSMVSLGIRPQRAVFEAQIAAYALVKHMAGAQSVLEKMKEYDYAPNVRNYLSLIEGFSRAGDLKRALTLFRILEDKNCLGRNPPAVYELITRCCIEQGLTEEAQKILSRWKIRPDFEVTHTIRKLEATLAQTM